MNAGTLRFDGPAGVLRVLRYPAAAGAALAPVVFIHPVNTGAAVWASLIDSLGGERLCLAPDLRGHGDSAGQGPFDIDGYAADVLAVMDQAGVARAHLVGGSIGGPLGVLLAARAADRVLSIASLGGALRLHLDDAVLEAIRAQLDGQGTLAVLQQLVPQALASARRGSPLAAQAIAIAYAGGRSASLVYEIIRAAFRTDVGELALQCRAPSLVVNGSEDATCTVEDGRRMAAALGSEPVVLDGVGHLPMLEAPGQLAALLRAHWARFEPGP